MMMEKIFLRTTIASSRTRGKEGGGELTGEREEGKPPTHGGTGPCPGPRGCSPAHGGRDAQVAAVPAPCDEEAREPPRRFWAVAGSILPAGMCWSQRRGATAPRGRRAPIPYFITDSVIKCVRVAYYMIAVVIPRASLAVPAQGPVAAGPVQAPRRSPLQTAEERSDGERPGRLGRDAGGCGASVGRGCREAAETESDAGWRRRRRRRAAGDRRPP
jgi:hypothetical protein